MGFASKSVKVSTKSVPLKHHSPHASLGGNVLPLVIQSIAGYHSFRSASLNAIVRSSLPVESENVNFA